MVASRRPDLALGVCLLNATPFWSSAPNPETEPEAAMPVRGSTTTG